MSRHHRLVVAALLPLALQLSCDAGSHPSPQEQRAFDVANRSYQRKSWAEACRAFSPYLEQFPAAELTREGQVKRAVSCLAARVEPKRSVDDLHHIAESGPDDFGRALAHTVLCERGERALDNQPDGRCQLAVDQLQRISLRSGRQADEARERYIALCFAELERSGDLRFAKRILAAHPDPQQRDRALYERGVRQLQNEATAPQGKETLLALGEDRDSAQADVALLQLASWCEGRNELAQAVLHDEAVVALGRGSAHKARESIARIKKPELTLEVQYVELPGGKPELKISFRNQTQVELTLRHADPLQQDAAAMFGGGAAMAGAAGAIIRTWTEPLEEPAPHQAGDKTIVLDIDQPGSYALEARAKELVASTSILITPLTALLKMAASQVAIWTVDAESGQAVANAEVALYVDHGKSQQRLNKTADKDGLCLFDVEGPSVKRIDAWSGTNNQFAFVSIGSSKGFGSAPRTYLGYVRTDRPLYKPGETVGVMVLLRARDKGPSQPVADATLEIRLNDATGREVDKRQVKTSAFGTAYFDLPLKKDAQLGRYTFRLRSDTRPFRSNEGVFQVEEYKPPEVLLQVAPVGQARSGEIAKLRVTASHYFGGPVARAQGVATITERPWQHAWGPWADEPPPDPAVARRERYRRRFRGSLQTVKLLFTTDDSGAAVLEVPTRGGSGSALEVQLQLTDASRREVGGAGTIYVSSPPYFVDLRTDRVLYQPGERIAVELRAEDANARPVSPRLELRMQLIEDDKPLPVLRRLVDLVNGRAAIALDADALGPIRLELWSADDSDQAAPLATSDLWLTNEAKPTVAAGEAFQVIIDTVPLRADGTVRALVATPSPGGHILATIEGDDLHLARSLELTGRARFFELPLSPAMSPNAFVHIARVEKKNLLHWEREVRVRGGGGELDVRASFPTQATAPGTRLPLTVAARSQASRGQPLELAVTIVDEALYGIVPEPSDLLSFVGPSRQSAYVQTSVGFQQRPFRPPPPKPQPSPEPGPESAHDGLLDKLVRSTREGAQPRELAAKQATESAAGPAAPTAAQAVARADEAPAAEVKVRKDFGSSAGWFPQQSGRVGSPLRLRAALTDSLTSWRATVIALTRGPEIGVERTTIRTEKPLMVRLQAPRFFTERDEVTLSAIINSRFATPVPVSVRFTAPGLRPLSGAQHKVIVPPAGEKRVDSRFVVQRAGEIRIQVVARALKDADAVEQTLSAVVHGSAQRRSLAGRLETEATLSVELPRQRNAAGTRFELNFSPSLVSVMLDALPYLAHYPYGCTEQTLSRFVPAAIAARVVGKLELSTQRVPADLDRMVAAGLQRLYSLQHGDGGWGWWHGDASNPWMTAYAVYGLMLARDAGLGVDGSALERGRGFLIDQLVHMRQRPEHHAFAVFVLALTGGAPEVDVDALYKGYRELSPRGRAMAALALVAARDKRADEAIASLDDLIQASTQRPESYVGHADSMWQTSAAIEATAYAIMALQRHDPTSPQIKPLVDFLVLRRNGGKWHSTRDTAMAVYALAEIAIAEEAGVARGALTVLVNGMQKARLEYEQGGATIEQPIVLDDSAFRSGSNRIELRREGSGTAYYAALWDVYNRNEDIKGVGSDVTLSRRYTLLGREGADQPPQTEFEQGMALTSGERVQVDIEMRASKPVEFVSIEDFKPAGLEAVLLKSGPEVCRNACTHAELRRDRVAMFLTELTAGTTTLSYELRAEVPGKFHALPARFEAMYAPEIQATSDELRVVVRDQE
ncbi:MAG: MG2 domain-containing protein [Pseudomonadota bacterium]